VFCRWRRCAWCASLLVVVATAPVNEILASPQPLLMDDHVAVEEDVSLTLNAALTEAVANYPEMVVLDARLRQANAWQRRSRSWIADTPAISLRYTSDRWQQDERLTEYEAGLELPLWRWGGRHAAKSLATSFSTVSTTATVLLNWRVAGFLRESLWDLAAAEDDLAAAQREAELAGKLRAAVEQRYQHGDVSRSDVMLAEASHLSAEYKVIGASSMLVDAQRRFIQLTSLSHHPPFKAEDKCVRTELSPEHPALLHAEAEVRRAAAELELMRKTAGGQPKLLLGPRRERPAMGDQFEESIGITLTLPVGGAAHRSTQVSVADRALADAQASRAHVVRDLAAAFHEAEHELAVVEQSLVLAVQVSDLNAEQFALAQRAYEQGELDLFDLLKLQDAVLSAQAEKRLLETERKRQIARYNQALGELP